MAEGRAYVNAEPVSPGPEGLSVTVGDVERELGAIINRKSTVFPTENREKDISALINKERIKFLTVIRISETELVAEGEGYTAIAEECIMFRVVIRVLRIIDANRTQVGLTSYRVTIANIETELRGLELWLSEQFHPSVRGLYDPTTVPYSPAKTAREAAGYLEDQYESEVFYLP